MITEKTDVPNRPKYFEFGAKESGGKKKVLRLIWYIRFFRIHYLE